MMDAMDELTLRLWLRSPKITLKAIKEYSKEIKQTPNLEEFSHRFNITRRIAEMSK